MHFVDTNYFIRFYLCDLPDQYGEVKTFFEKVVRGEITAFTSTIVFFEINWVMSSFYQKSKKEVIEILTGVLEMSFVCLSERGLLYEALGCYQKNNLSLEDCYNLVYAKTNSAQDIATFDQKLQKEFRKYSKTLLVDTSKEIL